MTVVSILLALVLSLPGLGLHNAAQGFGAAHVHHTPAHPVPPDMPDDGYNSACEALCTGSLLTGEIETAYAPVSRAEHPQPHISRLWADWVRPLSPPPKNLA